MSDFVRTEPLDDTTVLYARIEVPDDAEWCAMPRDVFVRLLREAGYEETL